MIPQPGSSSKKITLLKKHTGQPGPDGMSKTQQSVFLNRNRISFAGKGPVTGIVHLRQKDETYQPVTVIRRPPATPTPKRNMSPSVSELQETSQTSRSNFDGEQKKENELVDYLLHELTAVETELNESVRFSVHDRMSTPTADFATKTPKRGFFKSVICSPAFSSDKERSEYLVKELEV